MVALSVLPPTGSVMVPVDEACDEQPAFVLAVNEKLAVTLAPLKTICSVDASSGACPHQSTVTDCDAVLNVPPLGVTVTSGVGQLGSPCRQTRCAVRPGMRDAA